MRRWFAIGLLLALALAQTARADPPDIQNPVWLQQPNAADFAQNYPSQAASQAVEGRATIECYVRLDTTLNCSVTAESPASWGFGDAALAIARSFRVEPARIDGEAVEGGRIRRTIRFVLPEDSPENWTPEERAYVEVATPPDLPTWDEAPTSSMVLMATPAAARDANTQGRGVLSCRVGDARRLRCESLFETPQGSGFAAAAMTLVPFFRIAEGDSAFMTKYATDSFVLPISFGGAPELTPVNRDFAGMGPLNLPPIFAPQDVIPQRARAARVSGTVVALCTLGAATPALICVVERETPVQWGFAAPVLEMLTYFPAPPPQSGMIPGDQIRFTVEFRPN